jgi:hypothetical protein
MAKAVATDEVAYKILESVRERIRSEGDIASPSMSDAIRRLAKMAGVDIQCNCKA